ncbi:hypothetical protein CC80DRAFT_463932 [Byssothecium circinans]|uniref:Nuclear GTPase SLIP-GC n=1 Tax=Byssothecium circinans TaxID=147558 RepID=A0A6A5UJE6_9PLEO|nr:hypothetical protein CC80DRAFT_463932 [Byssothecium circinans]
MSPHPSRLRHTPYVPPAAPTSYEAPAQPVKAEHLSPVADVVKAERHSPFRIKTPEPEVTFDPEHHFKRDISPSGEDVIKPTDRFLREIMDQQVPEVLEAGVAKSIKVLDSLKTTFSRYAASSPDAAAWVEAINKLSSQAARTRTVVGVVGNTGAGKSSVINALLDEERLVPTNCMRACTAVVTSISMNTSKDPGSKYRAEVQFIEKADWEKELKTLMAEFLTENGTLSSDARDPNSDAGVAWQKFHATYPKIPKDDLASWTVEKLMAEKTVLSCLGTTKYIRSGHSDQFYSELQKYVDSKEKVIGPKDKDKNKEQKKSASKTEYWALIKEVRIFTKSDALSTGAVIVDLPGVHDSNAARAAVAERYMKQCTGLWIVAPITRAVDDKAAKNLLGETFKRQLKYDGNYSSVTFICSKTDDISITEATGSLELEDQISYLEEQQQGYKRQIVSIEKEVETLKDSIAVYSEVMEEAEKDTEVWEKLQDDADSGETVFAPAQKASNKRKRRASAEKSRKRRTLEDDSDIEYIASDNEELDQSDEDSDNEGCEPPKEPLTVEQIKAKIDELRQSKKTARQEKAMIRKQIPDLRAKIHELKEKVAEIQGEINALCIAERNKYSKGAIQQDFAAGIKELDMENAEEEDEEAFNPDEDQRDYEEVARSLPVFCVSSRAYQKMCGRLKKDGKVPGFRTPEETEMPQLQQHCKKLTEAGRIQACRKFLLNLVQQLNTFTLWASNDGTGLKMTDEDKRKQHSYLQKRLSELEKGLEQAVAACLSVMKKELRNQIFDRYPELIEEAVDAAPQTAHSWGYRHEGGLHYATYKAVVRRNGSYHSPTAGHRDFNAELIDPIIKRLATGWERAFQNRLPKAFDTYTADSGKVLHKFHETIEDRARHNGVGLANLAMLKSSIYTYEQLFRDLNVQYLAAMTEAQRDANRDFVPTIANIMDTAYDICTNERGPGSYMRMKGHMTSHVEQVRHSMFKEATMSVESHLNQMCRALEEMMSNGADDIFAKMRADYLQVLGGVQVSKDVVPREEKALKGEIKKMLNEVDGQFERIAKGELEEEKVDVDEEQDKDEPSADGHKYEVMDVDDGRKKEEAMDVDAAAEPEVEKRLHFDNDNDESDSVMGSHGGSAKDDAVSAKTSPANDGNEDDVPEQEL